MLPLSWRGVEREIAGRDGKVLAIETPREPKEIAAGDDNDSLTYWEKQDDLALGLLCPWSGNIGALMHRDSVELWANVKPVFRVSQAGADKRVKALVYRENNVLANDGKVLLPWDISSQDAFRILAHTTTTTSHRCENDKSMGLNWLTLERLTCGHVSVFPTPQTAVPLLVWKGGRTVRAVGRRID